MTHEQQIIILQSNACALKIIGAWMAGELSEERVAKALELPRVQCRMLREKMIADAKRIVDGLHIGNPPQEGEAMTFEIDLFIYQNQ